MNAGRILIVEDERTACTGLGRLLSREGYAAECAYTFREAERMVASAGYDGYLIDVRLPDGNGLDLIPGLRKESPDTVIVAFTAYGTIEDAVSALKAGADHYLIKPIDPDELLLTLKREFAYREMRAENRTLKAYLSSVSGFESLVGSSPAIRPVFDRIGKLCDSVATVLITGESGTGKELAARTLHYAGSRRDGRFVAVHCAALPAALLESELFGYVKGAFTGALKNHPGRFEYAAGGTVFLDEIGELSPEIQIKLLRVLQERVVERLGSNREIPIDVRIVASTNRDLEEMVKKGLFREDLFWRIDVVEIRLPPLRERKEDIELLAKHFLEKYSGRLDRPVPAVSPEVRAVFARYDWPGNVRELENVLERALALMEGPVITLDALPSRLRTGGVPDAVEREATLKSRVKKFEKRLIAQALNRENGNRVRTAERLGVSLRSLQYKISEYGL